MRVHLHELPPTHALAGRLGRHVFHDPRSFAFAHTSLLPYVRTVQWSRRCDPYDQGDLGSCTGNAMAGLLMTGPFYEEGREFTEKDAIAIYSEATHLDNVAGIYPPTDTGSSGLAVMKVARKRGLIRGFRHAFTLQSALQALQAGPVITGVTWYSGFDSPVGDRAVVSILPGDTSRGGHEFVVDGIDIQDGSVSCTNSWGTGWGDRGKFRMSFETWRRLLKERGDVTVALD